MLTRTVTPTGTGAIRTTTSLGSQEVGDHRPANRRANRLPCRRYLSRLHPDHPHAVPAEERLDRRLRMLTLPPAVQPTVWVTGEGRVR